MNCRDFYLIGWLISLVVLFGSCIHEYPIGYGEDPTKVMAGIELEFDLSWENMNYTPDFSSSRAKTQNPHKFIFEIIQNGRIIATEKRELSSEDFAKGYLNHKISSSLKANEYQLAVWYEFSEKEENEFFEHQNLNNIFLISQSLSDHPKLQCGYANDLLDLRGFSGYKGEPIVKKLKLGHPGARFEIIATDIQEFISEQKAALNQGDIFTMNIVFGEKTPSGFNVFEASPVIKDESIEYSGELFFPFAEYDELKLAEAYLFCREADYITAKIITYNSARKIVSQTPYFSFPLKRGYITQIKGEFLSFPLNGSLTIDHIWEGEILFEI